MVQKGYKHSEEAILKMRRVKAAARAKARGPRVWSEEQLEKKRQRQARRHQDPVYRREWWIRHMCRRYNSTPEQLDEIIKNAEGRCDICWGILFGDDDTHLDHCHEGNYLRGLLCRGCNRTMAALDAAGWLKKALDYRKRARLRWVATKVSSR